MAKKSTHGGARPGAGRSKSDRDDVTVKADRQVIAKARFLAESEGISLAELVTETLRPIIERKFAKKAEATKPKPEKGTDP